MGGGLHALRRAAPAVLLAACSPEPEPAPGPADAAGGQPPAARDDAAGLAGDGGGRGDAALPGFPDVDPAEYRLLSETGLFSDIAADEVSPAVRPFRPVHVLWSDGADKRRWVHVPPGTAIDTSDMDRWDFPVGTRLFKEFTRDGVRVETRLIQRTGPGPEAWWLGAFVWREDGSDAEFAPEGAANVVGTDHDVPGVQDCWACHLGQPGRALGFQALQLAGADGGLALADLAAAGLLSAPPPAGEDYAAPGDPGVAAALGYLHANCGPCHNPRGIAWPDAQMDLMLRVDERGPEDTAIYRTTLLAPLQWFQQAPFAHRVVPGDPQASALLHRMSRRGDEAQMPPIASERVDDAGVALVRDWIAGLVME